MMQFRKLFAWVNNHRFFALIFIVCIVGTGFILDAYTNYQVAHNPCLTQGKRTDALLDAVINKYENYRTAKVVSWIKECTADPLRSSLDSINPDFYAYTIESWVIGGYVHPLENGDIEFQVYENRSVHRDGVSGGSYEKQRVAVALTLTKVADGRWLISKSEEGKSIAPNSFESGLYRDFVHGFSIQAPAGTQPPTADYDGEDVSLLDLSMSGPTNTAAGFLLVNIVDPAGGIASNCMRTPVSEKLYSTITDEHATTINGIPFYTYTSTVKNADQFIVTRAYRTLKGDTCFAILTSISGTQDTQDREVLRQSLDPVINTFKFAERKSETIDEYLSKDQWGVYFTQYDDSNKTPAKEIYVAHANPVSFKALTDVFNIPGESGKGGANYKFKYYVDVKHAYFLQQRSDTGSSSVYVDQVRCSTPATFSVTDPFAPKDSNLDYTVIWKEVNAVYRYVIFSPNCTT